LKSIAMVCLFPVIIPFSKKMNARNPHSICWSQSFWWSDLRTHCYSLSFSCDYDISFNHSHSYAFSRWKWTPVIPTPSAGMTSIGVDCYKPLATHGAIIWNLPSLGAQIIDTQNLPPLLFRKISKNVPLLEMEHLPLRFRIFPKNILQKTTILHY
jgi:hypothetical protein